MPVPFNPRGSFIPPEVGGVSGGPVRRELPPPNLGGLNIPREGVPPAGPSGGIMGGVGMRPSPPMGGLPLSPPPMGEPSLPASPSPANSTLPPMMRNGGVGGMAPRPAQGNMMRRQRGRGGMSMF